jgi:MoxR-like ATPase
MANPTPAIKENPAKEAHLEEGTYEIIRNRLRKQGNELRTRLDTLNHKRREVFGSIETRLLATERITTDNNCVPIDMVPVNDLFVFGYNVHMGLKTETSISDVFSVYCYQNHSFVQQPLDLIADKRFEEDFKNLYKYYRNTQFAKFALLGQRLFMIFQVGKSQDDIKTFKWVIEGDKLTYVDNRSEGEFSYPDQYQFKWKRTSREARREGKFPHISIADRVFVETIGGDLTIKIENNTASGEGIYSEEVKHNDQTLDDAEIFYAIIGSIIVLKIKPFQENEYRYIVYNEKIRQARRIDSLKDSCVFLPDDHGIIFANGYYLQTGEYKLFDTQMANMLFEKRIASPNGEDFLYVFYSKVTGIYELLSYNLIEQKVAIPIICHGYSIFENGELCYFKGEDEPKKHHVVQIWQTPYVDPNFPLHTSDSESYLYKIGNKDVVRAMAECNELLTLIDRDDSYANLYLDLVKMSTDIIDSYHWLNKEETLRLIEPLAEVKQSASTAIEEFEKVTRIKKNTAVEVERVTGKITKLFADIKRQQPESIDYFVRFLAELRTLRGETISLKSLRYIAIASIESKEKEIEAYTIKLSDECVQFLLKENALVPYHQKVTLLQEHINKIEKVIDASKTEEEITKTSQELEMLIDVVSNLKIEDATQTTRIIDNISSIYAHFNQIKAALKRKRQELVGIEGKAEFASQLKLIDQGVANYLDISKTPQKCDEYITKLMVQLEELEGKFTEFEEFTEKITEKREEIYNAFESKKLSLVEARNKRATSLLQSAERILKGIGNRVTSFANTSEINGYFASDLMVDKVRDIIKQLIEIGDTVKSDDIQSRLKTAQEEAIRQLKDRQELFVDGASIIKFGDFKFSVNTQPLDLTMVYRNGDMYYHLTGTNFFEKVTDSAFNNSRNVWEQSLVSENKQVYRAEYLAYQLIKKAQEAEKTSVSNGMQYLTTEVLHKLIDEELLSYIQKFMAPRYNEGYIKGVHDYDTRILLRALLNFTQTIDLLKYPSPARACASLYWQYFADAEHKLLMYHRLKGVGIILQVFPKTREFGGIIEELQAEIAAFSRENKLFSETFALEAGEYLFYEITRSDSFIANAEAADLYNQFMDYLATNHSADRYHNSIETLENTPIARYKLIKKWLGAYIDFIHQEAKREYLDETAVLLYGEDLEKKTVIQLSLKSEIEGLQGSHAVIENGRYQLDYNSFMTKLKLFDTQVVPQFSHFQDTKKKLLEDFKQDLRLEEFKSHVLTSFIRNKLIDQVYLPMIGANLAKQIGTADDTKRTDRMGMLLLISPPGYGKTTLMEYIANRLGIVFMKINGPAIGHKVTSLDPAEAPNASAREEIEKLSLALEMGDNVMLYLDDIQHCNPEFLQKFISLCDAQRKIEAVYKGKSRTYDLRGKKVCVVMAGNPYTESGEKFQIPDMLANRADIYNLGDIIGNADEAFKLSYIENSLTSNPVMQRLSNKSHVDVFAMVRLAQTGSKDGITYEASHSAEEINEYVSVLKKLLVIQETILKVNKEYIHSAAQADEFRTEPPFKLQGSYRNMNKMADKVVALMNDQELEMVIQTHYENEAQTLTTGAEANLLKFKELIGKITPTEQKRWEDIKATYVKNKKMRGLGTDNQVGQVVLTMESISEGLQGIKQALLTKE